MEEAPGDILVFLTGQEEIDALGQLLEEKARQLPDGAAGGQELQVLRIYAALPPEQQMKVRGWCSRHIQEVSHSVGRWCGILGLLL